jgi:DNA polymerase III epsilon subunit-like protein
LSDPPETFVSVDIEAAGPNPSRYSLLAIGACLVADPDAGFYVELQPTSDDALPSALAVSGLSMEELRQRGQPPADAMADFAAWIERVTPPGSLPVFVGFNAPFDWMFVNDQFHEHLGRNPFGHVAVDIKSYAMGRDGGSFADTSLARLVARYGGTPNLSHHALEDARVQADLFARLRAR